MTYLIDGYNLLHAIGLASRGMPAKGLARARSRLLDWLADRATERPDMLRVIFDAQKSPAQSAEHDHRGIRVRFAHRQTADELIEELIRAESRPSQIAVVSNDGQVQDSGRRRGCTVFTCQVFVDWLIANPTPAARDSAAHPDKEIGAASPDELAAWLEVFSAKPPKKKR